MHLTPAPIRKVALCASQTLVLVAALGSVHRGRRRAALGKTPPTFRVCSEVRAGPGANVSKGLATVIDAGISTSGSVPNL
mgnify:CR=1 FL=1